MTIAPVGRIAVRGPRDGDRIALAGGGHARVGRILQAGGVPARLRAQVPVVVVDEVPVWVAGHRASSDALAGSGEPAVVLEVRPAWSDARPGEVLVSPERLQKRISELACQISEDYRGRDLLMVGVLKGAVFFIADLVRQLDIPCELDFMAVSSYGSKTHSSGVVRILKDLDQPIAGRNVLVVEDVIDSGLTLSYLLRNLALAPNRPRSRCPQPADQAGAPAPRPGYALRGI